MSSPAPQTAQLGADEQLPRRFGRYVLFDRIGRGGMADIYLARYETELGVSRLAVVKQILPRLAADTQFEKMLVAEAKLASRLSHASVVQVIDLGRENDRLFIAMEYVEGFDLNELLLRCTRARLALPAPFAFFVVREALRSLDYAHRRTNDDGAPLGIVHRDVSPSNVLVSFEGEVKLCDFGISRAYGEGASLSSSAHDEERVRVAGKAAYMSPEHARGDDLDARADIFSAGVILWELVAGRRRARMARREGPGDEGARIDDALLLDIARRGEMPPLPERPLPDLDALRDILARVLAPAREDRYPSAAALLADLDTYVARNRLDTTQLRLGAWLTEQLGDEIVHVRRARERAAAALQLGPPVEIVPIFGPDAQTDPGTQLDPDTSRSGAAPWQRPPARQPPDDEPAGDPLFGQTDPDGVLVATRSTLPPELAAAEQGEPGDPEERVPTDRPPPPATSPSPAPAASAAPAPGPVARRAPRLWPWLVVGAAALAITVVGILLGLGLR